MPAGVPHSIAAADLAWAQAIERRIYFLLLLAAALAWTSFALLSAKTYYPLLVLRALIVGTGLVVVTASALAVPAEGLVYLASARFRRARDSGAHGRARVRAGPLLGGWCIMLAVSVANGVVRDLTYGRALSELAAHQLSSASSILLLGIVMRAYVRRVPPVSGTAALGLGCAWAALTVAFEFLFFHYAAGHSWSALWANYDVGNGRLWPFILLWIAVAPYTLHRLEQMRRS